MKISCIYTITNLVNGKIMPETTKIAINKANIGNKYTLGRKLTEEHRKKLKEINSKPKSEEHKRNIGLSNMGRVVSEETRKKISNAHKEYHASKK